MYAIKAQQTFYIEMSTMSNRLRAMLLQNEYNDLICQGQVCIVRLSVMSN